MSQLSDNKESYDYIELKWERLSGKRATNNNNYYTMKELHQLCKSWDIEVEPSMTKQDIVNVIKAVDHYAQLEDEWRFAMGFGTPSYN